MDNTADNTLPEVAEITAGLLREVHLDEEATEHHSVDGPHEVLPSVFRVTEAATALVGASTIAAAAAWQARGGPVAATSANSRHACVSFRSVNHMVVAGASVEAWDALSGHYPAGNDEWVQIHCNFDHHRDAVLAQFGLGANTDRETLGAAIGEVHAAEFEDAVLGSGGVAVKYRSAEEWQAHPQGQVVSAAPLMSLTKRNDAEVAPGGVGGLDGVPPRPLAGLRVLDLTRIIAGPVCGKTLAAHGAEVMRIGADDLAVVDRLLPDTCVGKRFAHVDLRTDQGRSHLRALAADSDVVVQGFRPGAMDALGFSVDELHDLHPALVVATLSAWGNEGPWAQRRGFDSITQTASGIARTGADHAGTDRPTPLPCQLLDYGSGHLLAMGVAAAVAHQQTQGGGWHVDVALARTGAWLQRLGTTDPTDAAPPTQDDVGDLLTTTGSGYGEVTLVSPPGNVEGAPLRWGRPPSLPGADPAAW